MMSQSVKKSIEEHDFYLKITLFDRSKSVLTQNKEPQRVSFRL